MNAADPVGRPVGAAGSGRRGSARRTIVRWIAAGVAVVVALGVAGAFLGSREADLGDEPCSSPTSIELVDLAARSQAVVHGTVEGVADLSDGTTQSAGWLIRVDEQLAGGSGEVSPTGQVIALWPSIGDGEPASGEQVVAYLGAHPDPTSADGRTLPAFESWGLFIDNGDDTVSRLCKDSRSEPVDRSVVGS